MDLLKKFFTKIVLVVAVFLQVLLFFSFYHLQQVHATNSIILVNDPNLFFTPGNWIINGSSSAQTSTPGAYFKVGFSGTTVILNFDTSSMSTEFPKIAWAIDGSAIQRQILSSASANLILNLTPSPLANSNHQLQVWADAISRTDRWATPTTNPTDQFRLLSISIDNGATSLTPSLKPKRFMVFGDSITEGEAELGAADTVANKQWTTTWDKLIGDYLNAETTAIGYQGLGYETDGGGNVPGLLTSYNLIKSGVNRSFSPSPDYIMIQLGTNNPTTASDVSTILSNLRSAAPSSAIFLDIPFGLNSESTIAQAFNQQSDPKVFLIDIGQAGSNAVTNNSYDGIHPNQAGNALLAPLVYNEVANQTAITFSNNAVNLSPSSATVSWDTNKVGSSYVSFGPTTSYGNITTETDTTGVKSHSITIPTLGCVTYHYQASSHDILNRATNSSDQSFTSPCSGSASVLAASATTIASASSGNQNLLDSGNNGINLAVPAGATSNDASFQIHQLDPTAAITALPLPSNTKVIGQYLYDLKAVTSTNTLISTFSQRLPITLTYDPSLLNGSIDSSSLKIYRSDGGAWTALPDSRLNSTAHTVSASTGNFSSFALLANTVITPTPSPVATPTPIASTNPAYTPVTATSATLPATGIDISTSTALASGILILLSFYKIAIPRHKKH